MRPFVARPVSHLQGEISLLGDKSIAHRSIIISAISRGSTKIENFPTNKDCLWTIKALRKLGVKITQSSRENYLKGSTVTVKAKGLLGLVKSKGPILVGDSGTTLRLLLGVLAGQNFKTQLVAGSSLSQRPMRRVTEPLRMMGAKIKSKIKYQISKIEEYPPITIIGGNLKPITYQMPVASAQVKSAIILAALYVKGKTYVIERIPARDHTERMLKLFKARLKVNPSTTLRVDGERSRTIKQNTIVIKGNHELVSPGILTIPGDISSAAFFIVLATIIPDSTVYIKNVGLNPSRTAIIKVLKRMGADIKVKNPRHRDWRVRQEFWRKESRIKSSEPRGDLIVKSSALKGTTVRKDEVVSLIDELPILMVAASIAKGRTVFENVGELRVKETDRIRSMSGNLRKMGANITVFSATSRGGSAKHFGGKTGTRENVIIQGVKQLKAAKVKSFGDHRTAMSMVIAGSVATGNTQLDDISCINKSFPGFLSLLQSLKRRKISF